MNRLFLLIALFSLHGVLQQPLAAAARSAISSYQGAVLQRDMPITFAGKGSDGEVSLTFNGETKTTTYKDRRMKVEFPAMPAGGPYELQLTDKSGTHTVDDIYVGDIWVCVGQSNMMFPMTKMHSDATWKPATDDSYPLIRRPGKNGWAKAENIGIIKNWPGTPYFFARALHQELGIAIGLKTAGAGGTSLWEWTPTELHETPELAPLFKVMQERVQYYKDGKLPDKGKVDAYPKAKGFSSYRYPYFPKKGYANPSLIKNETWVSKTPSRGIIFWQGENDVGIAANYEPLFRGLIKRYQANADREFPFFFIQLPTYSDKPGAPTKMDGIVGLRDAQRRVAESDPTVEMVVTYDIYSRGIHPAKKNEYGARLANAVLGKIYGKDTKWIHAKFDRISTDGNTLLVHFKDTGDGLKTTDDQAPIDFTIAGEDQVFHAATAKIVDGTTIALTAAEVSNPVAVRYAWQNSPKTNLVGDGNLPVSPFRSDQWELYPVKDE